MRIPGNKLSHLSDFFFSELSPVYDRGEIAALFAAAASHYLGFSRTELLTRAAENLNQSDLLKLYDCAKELRRGTPLQYILGSVSFYGVVIRVNKEVLIPRPETEELTDMVVKENPDAASFLDFCTGSGCIAIAIKKHLPAASVTACDISAGALQLTTANARDNDTLVYFFSCDVLQSQSLPITGACEVIVSNPPYVCETERSGMDPQVLEHEPHLALFVPDNDAIVFYRKIIGLCETYLAPAGRLYFELNPQTAGEVLDHALSSGLFIEATLVKDLSGKERFLKAIRKSGNT